MAEWLKAAVLKTASREPGRGFESYSLRQPTLKLRLASHHNTKVCVASHLLGRRSSKGA